MAFTHSERILVKQIKGKGRGVFAREDLAAGTVIETVPVLVLDEDDIEPTALAGYCFLWSAGKVALPLGYGALYNHSVSPNAEYIYRAPRTKVFRTLREIAKGEEITINYNGTPDDPSPVGFEVK